MTLYRQVSGTQVPLTEEEIKQLNQSWEAERQRQLTDELQERAKCYAGNSFRLFELLWEGIEEGKIPGRDTAFYSCIAEAKTKAEVEILKETGMAKEEFETARQQLLLGEGHETL